jgi:hypothetical protein
MENVIPNNRNVSTMNTRSSMTITIIGSVNMAPSASWSLPASSFCSYTAGGDSLRPSSPLSEGAVRIGNSILSAVVPEEAILRDATEDF